MIHCYIVLYYTVLYELLLVIYVYIKGLLSLLVSPVPKPCWRAQQGALDKVRQRILCNEMDLLQQLLNSSPTSSWIMQGLQGCRNQNTKVTRHHETRASGLDIYSLTKVLPSVVFLFLHSADSNSQQRKWQRRQQQAVQAHPPRRMKPNMHFRNRGLAMKGTLNLSNPSYPQVIHCSSDDIHFSSTAILTCVCRNMEFYHIKIFLVQRLTQLLTSLAPFSLSPGWSMAEAVPHAIRIVSASPLPAPTWAVPKIGPR